MSRLKQLSKVLPQPARNLARKVWTGILGNAEFNVLRLLCDPNKLALDIGANRGEYSIFLATKCKGCVAFEPNPRLARGIEQRVRTEAPTVRVNACALSDRQGEVVFSIPMVDGEEVDALATIESANHLGGAEVKRLTVPCRRLDEIELEPVGVIKLDAEGHEVSVLHGARGLIERDRPALMIEAEERHKAGAVDQVRTFFAELGYTGFFLLGRKIVPLAEFNPKVHQDSSNIHLGEVAFDGVYVNNFIFAADPERIARLNRAAGR